MIELAVAKDLDVVARVRGWHFRAGLAMTPHQQTTCSLGYLKAFLVLCLSSVIEGHVDVCIIKVKQM